MVVGKTVKRIFGKGSKFAARPARVMDSFGQATGRIGMYRTAGNLGKQVQSSFIGGAFMPAVKAGVAFGVSSGLGEIADQTDSSLIGAVAGLGSFWAGTIGFRQALRAPLRGARAKWGYRKDALGGSVRQLSRVYDKYMYAPERMVGKAMSGGIKGFGRAMIGTGKGEYASKVPLLLRPAHGALGIGRAVAGGTVDRFRHAARVISGGNRGNVLPGIGGRLMGVRHPFWGAMALGGIYGGARAMSRSKSGRIGDTHYAPAPSGGINPRNWGGGITMMNARGGVQHRMGSDTMSRRMARGGAY